jgi:hypothetical protein
MEMTKAEVLEWHYDRCQRGALDGRCWRRTRRRSHPAVIRSALGRIINASSASEKELTPADSCGGEEENPGNDLLSPFDYHRPWQA